MSCSWEAAGPLFVPGLLVQLSRVSPTTNLRAGAERSSSPNSVLESIRKVDLLKFALCQVVLRLRLFRAPIHLYSWPSLTMPGKRCHLLLSFPTPGGPWTKEGWADDGLPLLGVLRDLGASEIHLEDMPYEGVNPPNMENVFWRPKKLDKIAQWGEESAIIIQCCSKKTTGGNCQLCYILLSSDPRRMVAWGSELQGIDLSKLLTKTYTIPPKSRVFR